MTVTLQELNNIGQQLLQNQNFNLILKSNIEFMIKKQLTKERQRQKAQNKHQQCSEILSEIQNVIFSIVRHHIDEQVINIYDNLKFDQEKSNEVNQQISNIKLQLENIKKQSEAMTRSSFLMSTQNINFKKLKSHKAGLCQDILKTSRLSYSKKENFNDSFLQISTMTNRIQQMERSSVEISKKIAQVFEIKIKKLQQQMIEVKQILQGNIDANISSIWNILAQIQEKMELIGIQQKKQVQQSTSVSKSIQKGLKTFFSF